SCRITRCLPFELSFGRSRCQALFELFRIHLVDQRDLRDPVGRIDIEFEACSKLDGIIVRINPVDHPADAGLAGQFEENSPPELVDTTGPKATVSRVANRFDVKPRSRVVRTELDEKLQGLALDGFL